MSNNTKTTKKSKSELTLLERPRAIAYLRPCHRTKFNLINIKDRRRYPYYFPANKFYELINKLNRLGYIERGNNPSVIDFKLTDKGRLLLEEAEN